MRRLRRSESFMSTLCSRPRRSLYLDSLLCHRDDRFEETLTTSTPDSQASSMSGLKREDSPEQVSNSNEPPSSSNVQGRERRSSFSSSTTGDSGYGGSVLGNNFLEHKTVQHFENDDDYLFAMIEDLAEWISNIYDMDVTVDTLFGHLDSGVLLCRHANEVQKAGEEYIKLNNRRDLPMKVGNKALVIPQQAPNYRSSAQPGTFIARDNVANFIHWCRAFGIPDCLSFETEDLVLRKNVRSVILCLLEIGRVGAKFGMEAPDLVIMEQEIDAEIEADAARERAENGEDVEYEMVEEEFEEEEEEVDLEGMSEMEKSMHVSFHRDSSENVDEAIGEEVRDTNEEQTTSNDVTDSGIPVRRFRLRKRMVRRPKPVERPPYQPPPLIPPSLNNSKRQRPRPKCDMKSLDEMVRDIIKECTCDEIFPMKRLGEGKYQFGDNSTLIYVRILRYHVMVRVGGGWDTLNHFLEKYDPCRKHKSQSQPDASSKPISGINRFSGNYGVTRHQSEEPQPLRTSTPRKMTTPTPPATSMEELQARPAVLNKNYKEGMMNFVRNTSQGVKMRGRTASVDVTAMRAARNSLPKTEPSPNTRKSDRSSCELQTDSSDTSSVKLRTTPTARRKERSSGEPQTDSADSSDVKLRSSTSSSSSNPIDQLPQEPVDRIGSIYLHNTVDDLRRCLNDLQSSLATATSPTSIPKPPIVKVSAAAGSEALSAREMYLQMQKDFEIMKVGVEKDDDAVSVTSTCSSTSSAATTGSRRFVSRIPVPVRHSNPTTPELQRRKGPPPSNQTRPAGRCNSVRRKSMDSAQTSDAKSRALIRRGSMSSAKSTGAMR